MIYTISIDIPDELVGILGILSNPDAIQIAKDLQAQPKRIVKSRAKPKAEPEEQPQQAQAQQPEQTQQSQPVQQQPQTPRHTRDDIKGVANQCYKIPEKRDSMRDALVKLGFTKISDIPDNKTDEVYAIFLDILNL